MKKLLIILSLLTLSVHAQVATNSELEPNTLKQIKVVKDWEPVSNFEAFKQQSRQIPLPGPYLSDHNNRYGCIKQIKNVNREYTPPPGGDQFAWSTCMEYLHWLVETKPQILGDILLSWASAEIDPMVLNELPPVNSRGGSEQNTSGYAIPSTLGTFAQQYAIWYDEITYTPEERERVDVYMTRKLMEQKFTVIYASFKPCDINSFNVVMNTNPVIVDINTCQNIRMKVSVGEIMLGFRLENQTLLDKGHDDMYVVLSFINKDAINIVLASRGAMAYSYYQDYMHYYSILAEIYSTVGYDFFEHTLPRGAKVHEVIAFNYKILQDFTIIKEFAMHNTGAGSPVGGKPYSRIANMTQESFQMSQYANYIYNWKDGDKNFVKTHTKFVKRYMPHLYNFVVANYMDSRYGQSNSWGVHPYDLHMGNNFTEENSNAEAKLEAELSIFGIEDTTFNLKLDKVDFIETRPFTLEREEEYLKPYQLHKAVIHGDLKTKSGSNKKIDFRTLVYKYAGNQELVIHVDDRTVEPLKRHKNSLEKKCGSKVMEWGWLSFISKTNDINSTRSQQCIYDYFKEANDIEALELFQAVLGGTDSILDYLETNVEP